MLTFLKLLNGTEREKVYFDTLIAEAQSALENARDKQSKYYNLRINEFKINVGNQVLLETHMLSSAAKVIVAKVARKCEGPYPVKELIASNLNSERDDNIQVVNSDQMRIYKDRKANTDLMDDANSDNLDGDTSQENGNYMVNWERKDRLGRSIVENNYRS